MGQGAGPSLDVFASDAGAKQRLTSAIGLLSGDHPEVKVSDTAEGASDDATFTEAGVASLAFNWSGIEADGRLHTLADTPETLDPDKLHFTGEVVALVLLLSAS